MSDTFDSPDGQTQCEPKPVQKPTVGQIVHYVLDDGPCRGEHRPAIVVNDWDGKYDRPNLIVFTDGTNDGNAYSTGIYWATSVPYADPSENKQFSWHYMTDETFV